MFGLVTSKKNAIVVDGSTPPRYQDVVPLYSVWHILLDITYHMYKYDMKRKWYLCMHGYTHYIHTSNSPTNKIAVAHTQYAGGRMPHYGQEHMQHRHAYTTLSTHKHVPNAHFHLCNRC